MGMIGILREYLGTRAGAAAVWFGLTVPIVVSSVGLSVDVGQAYLTRERLSRSLDAAALAAAGIATDDTDVIEEKVNDFIQANYPEGKVGFSTKVDITENTHDRLGVRAYAEYKPAFAGIFGKDVVEVTVDTEVTKEVKAIEVVLVMDVTGSMGTKTNNKTRIDSLKDAAKLFVNTMFSRVKDENMVKIGLVPFSSSVNVGPYGLGKTLSGANYGTKFVNNPTNMAYSITDNNEWGGCIVEGASPNDERDHSGPWDMYRYCRTATGTPTNSRIKDCDPRNNNDRYTSNHQNLNCPRVPVMPMTNKKADLLTSINSLVAAGNTYINVGLVWGYRMISPEYPFEEGVSWTNEDWKKAVILMTDGVNEHHPSYSAYGPSATANMSNTKLNNRMLNVCDELREKNVLVYTITFDKGVSTATKKMFQECATTPAMWYDAPTDQKLQEVYKTIAQELANMHLSK